ncbi:MAG: ABC transporter permease [Oscillospiraceae bacterium]|nr:ABC transporter permease [Oscillospiraceae bacterium]
MVKPEPYLARKNLLRRPARTAALALLTAFLCLSVFAGSVVVMSLRNGLRSYGERLGADIVAVPYQARTKGSFESILLQGIPGMFYMDEQYYHKIEAIDGVAQAAPQFYLASTSAGCCSVPVQIIGFDPEKDFTVRPWIRESYAGTLGDGDLIVGSELTVPKDGTLTFYDTPCRVVAKLGRTGTGLDTAVYTNMSTIKTMMKNAEALGFRYLTDLDPDHAVSSVMVRVEEGRDVNDVLGDINVHVRHVEASASAAMLSSIAGGLEGVSGVIGVLVALVWLLALAVLAVAFAMISRERSREFAVLRVLGASRSMLSRLLLTESALIGAAGALAGLVLGTLILLPFGQSIRAALELPYLLPSAGAVAAIALGSFLLAVLAGSLAAAVSAWRVSRLDAGLLLKEGE